MEWKINVMPQLLALALRNNNNELKCYVEDIDVQLYYARPTPNWLNIFDEVVKKNSELQGHYIVEDVGLLLNNNSVKLSIDREYCYTEVDKYLRDEQDKARILNSLRNNFPTACIRHENMQASKSKDKSKQTNESMEKIKKAKELLDRKIITQEYFDELVKEYLNR